MTLRTTHHQYPPFPPGLPTAALLSISLAELQNPRTEQAEATRFFAACRDLGFFYLDLFGSDLGERIVVQAEELQLLQQEFYALSHEEKDLYGRDKVDPFFSYRWAPCIDGVKDVWGRPGRREMYSVSGVTAGSVKCLMAISAPRRRLQTHSTTVTQSRYRQSCRLPPHLFWTRLSRGGRPTPIPPRIAAQASSWISDGSSPK